MVAHQQVPKILDQIDAAARTCNTQVRQRPLFPDDLKASAMAVGHANAPAPFRGFCAMIQAKARGGSVSRAKRFVISTPIGENPWGSAPSKAYRNSKTTLRERSRRLETCPNPHEPQSMCHLLRSNYTIASGPLPVDTRPIGFSVLKSKIVTSFVCPSLVKPLPNSGAKAMP